MRIIITTITILLLYHACADHVAKPRDTPRGNLQRSIANLQTSQAKLQRSKRFFDPVSFMLTKSAGFYADSFLKEIKKKANIKGTIDNQSTKDMYFNGCYDEDASGIFKQLPGSLHKGKDTSLEAGGFMIEKDRDLKIKCLFVAGDYSMAFYAKVRNKPCTSKGNMLGATLCTSDQCKDIKLADVIKKADEMEAAKKHGKGQLKYKDAAGKDKEVQINVAHFAASKDNENIPLAFCDDQIKLCVTGAIGSGHAPEFTMEILNSDEKGLLKTLGLIS